jgi:hypothetical protein
VALYLPEGFESPQAACPVIQQVALPDIRGHHHRGHGAPEIGNAVRNIPRFIGEAFMKKSRVLLADDQKIVLEGLRSLL